MKLSRSFSAALAAALLTASVLIVPASAATGTVNAASGLRLRNGVGTGAGIMAVLPHGAQVDVLGVTEENWYQVSYNGTQGFVSGDYLNVTESEGEQPLEVVQEPTYGKVTAGPLNVRTQPTTDSQRVKQLAAGTVVELKETLDGWYAIDGGYVCADYIVIVDAAEAAAPSSGNGAGVVATARQYLGCPYVYGGTSPSGFDCSGFVQYVYRQMGITLNRTASSQMSNGVSVSRSELQPGDLVFFNDGSGRLASHVGIYIGGGQLIHASTPRTGVIISSMNTSYYVNCYVGARRIV